MSAALLHGSFPCPSVLRPSPRPFPPCGAAEPPVPHKWSILEPPEPRPHKKTPAVRPLRPFAGC
ncbi:hypothetical protein FM125_00465 [Micrococcus lylae]|uniref:Uncharacterized protein n=1 Tax=Micrococcus lylae TaxID=1273 RepID=A0A1R4I7V4_9MICC|nr:hypothetical protein FM125_00465 [Micrococcus lylae]